MQPEPGEEALRRRSNLLVLLGLAAFVLGLLVVYVITSDDDDGGGGGGGNADTVEVLVAGEELAAGARGDDILAQGRFRTERVNVNDRAPDALTAPSQLSGQVLTLTFAEGEQIRAEGLRSLGGPRAEIPEGFEAVSVDVGFVAGGANTIQPGDRVNVFLVIPATVEFQGVDDSGQLVAAPPPYAMPRTELLLTNTLVLDVQVGTSPLQVSQPQQPGSTPSTGGSGTIVVLAVDTVDAEKVVFGSAVNGADLYLSRVRLDENGNPSPPAGATPGQDFFTILAEEAGEAFSRSNG
jgi:Flp pilus assembly protein CpaB